MLDRVARVAIVDGRHGDLRTAHVDAEDGHGRGYTCASGTSRPDVDRRLAHKNVRTALIAGAISLIIFALSFFAGLVYT
jgi:hypothetical protein